jgi:hypothetical protein
MPLKFRQKQQFSIGQIPNAKIQMTIEIQMPKCQNYFFLWFEIFTLFDIWALSFDIV